ncbi:MAG: S8 family serine peptidase [Microcoleus sp.]|uniref:S8 family peptidase n=1 Tax=Microcoleus sp. TaxID=44472 RepID=UPI003C78FCC7
MKLANYTSNHSSPSAPKNLLATNEISTKSSIEVLRSNNKILDESPENPPQQADIDAFILNKNPTQTINSIAEKPQTSTSQTDTITGDTAGAATQNNIPSDSSLFPADKIDKISGDYLSDLRTSETDKELIADATPKTEAKLAEKNADYPAVETKDSTVSEICSCATNTAETKTENSPATETKNPTVSEIPNSDPKPENSPATETKKPTVSEIPKDDPNPVETKPENSPATETKNPTVSEIPKENPNPVDPKTEKSPAVEDKKPTVSEISNSDPNSADPKTENSPATETQNPTVSEILNFPTNPVDTGIDDITGAKIETTVFIQPEKPEISAIPAASADILTGEIENISSTPIDSPEILSETPENFPIISPDEISTLWETLNNIFAQQLPHFPETASSQNYPPSASKYIVTDSPTIIPEIAVTENYDSQQSENITADSDNQQPTTIDEYVNPNFDSENIAITSEIASDENSQPDNSHNIIADSATEIETDSEYPVTDTENQLEITPHSPQQNQPFIGIIDTGFTANNPNIDYSQIILGKDVIEGDNNPLLQANEGNQHGDTILEIISTSNNQNNTKKAPAIWLGRATGSGNWHQSLIEFADATKAAKQPNAVVNLSFDLTQINPDGTQTTRHFLTAEETAALKYAKDNNILIVAAAGNEGNLLSALGQASTEFDNIITVGAAENNYRAAYSSYGRGLDILAPTDTHQTAETATNATKQGTSIAAAKVTNTISQMWAANPSLDYQQIKNILLNTAKDIDVPEWDERTGYGILDAGSAIATAAETIPTIPVLVAAKYLTKSLISADENTTNTAAKPSSRAALTNATTNQPKTTSTSTGDYNQGTSSSTTEQPQNTTSNTSKYNNTTSTNAQTNKSYSHTNSNWNKSRRNTNSNSNSLYETTTDTTTKARDYTDKNLSLYSIERTNKSQENISRLKYEGTGNSQSSYKQKWSSNRNYTSPSQTQKSASDSYLNSQTQSDGKHDGSYAESNSKTQEESGSKSTTNNQYTSSNGSSGNNSTTQIKGKTNRTSSNKGNNYNSTYSGENSEVTQSDSHSKTSSNFSKTNNSSDNRSITNNIWDNTTTNGKTVGSSTRDTYSEGNNNYNTSYDDGKSKNTSNTDTYTQNQSQETNSTNGTNSWRNNRDNHYSVTSGNNTDTYKNGGDTRNHNRDHYSISKSNSSSSNSAGKLSSKNESERYSENQDQWDSEYKADTYTTKSNSDESTITASKSNSNTEGNNSNSSNSSDTSTTRNSQTVTTYKDGRKEENGSSTYEKWLRDSSYDSKGVVSDIYKYYRWSSSYTKSYFKGGYRWTETISGYDSESVNKRNVYTSSGSSWSWTRSGTVWDDGRNDWSESWSKSSWKDGKYLPSESESKRGGFDPKKTTPQVNDVPKFGEPPRLNKAPKNKPIDLQKLPKPSKDLLLIPTVIIKDKDRQFKDVFFGGNGKDDLANNPPKPRGGSNPPPLLPPDIDDEDLKKCYDILKRIEEVLYKGFINEQGQLEKSLRKREQDMLDDNNTNRLYQAHIATQQQRPEAENRNMSEGKGTWAGHQARYRKVRDRLNQLLDEWRKSGCNDGDLIALGSRAQDLMDQAEEYSVKEPPAQPLPPSQPNQLLQQAFALGAKLKDGILVVAEGTSKLVIAILIGIAVVLSIPFQILPKV